MWKVTESVAKIAPLEGVVALFAAVALAALPKLKEGFIGLDRRPAECSTVRMEAQAGIGNAHQRA